MTWITQPNLLYLLLVVPLLLLAAWHARRRRQRFLGRLGTQAGHGGSIVRGRRTGLATALGLCGLCALISGIAGPRWGRSWEMPTASGRDVMLVIDVSRSMSAETPSRLDRGLDGTLELLDDLELRGGNRLGMVVFAGKPFLICPLTHDLDHLREVVHRLRTGPAPPQTRPESGAVSGTRIGAAVELAVSSLAPDSKGAGDIVLLSDGDDPVKDSEWRRGATAAATAGIPVHVIGIGDTAPRELRSREGQPLLYEGAPVRTRLDDTSLKSLAALTHGQYVPAETRAIPLAELFHELIEPRPTREDSPDALITLRPRYPWFLAVALLALAAELCLGQRRLRSARTATKESGNGLLAAAAVLLLLGAAPHPDGLEQVRRGNAALKRGELDVALDVYDDAAVTTTDPGLVAYNQAVAYYRLGRFREAELHYRRCLSDAEGERAARAYLGLGNSLVRRSAGTNRAALHAAVACFERAAAGFPADSSWQEDALHNLELARLLLLQPAVEEQPEQPSPPEPGGANPPNERNPREDGDRRPGQSQGDPAPGSPSSAGSGEGSPRQTDRLPPPGRGNLPTVPDHGEVTTISPEDAAELLERAARRVRDEAEQRQREAARVPVAGVPDW